MSSPPTVKISGKSLTLLGYFFWGEGHLLAAGTKRKLGFTRALYMLSLGAQLTLRQVSLRWENGFLVLAARGSRQPLEITLV